MYAAATRLIHRNRTHGTSYVVLADFSEAHVDARNAEPVANGSRNSAYDRTFAGPAVV
ncbi:MAG: hypothetical protein JWN61_2250 [Pseudonocardiales bacterium]|nr:hypothetical protein [Jatrophihabitantaceae bacterium]MCW2604115.1 hypothetical protein [Pseudonocardiales bacterium]